MIADRFLIDVNPGFLYRHHDPNNVIDFRVIDTQSGLFIDGTGLAQISIRVNEASDRAAKLRPMPKHRPPTVACKSPHRYIYEEIFPLVRTLFEGVETWRPNNAKRALGHEYTHGTTLTVFKGHEFNLKTNRWTPISSCKQLYTLYILHHRKGVIVYRDHYQRIYSWFNRNGPTLPNTCTVFEKRINPYSKRIVASLTTFPGRMTHIQQTLDSLLNQTYPIETIHLHIPYNLSRFTNIHIDETQLASDLAHLTRVYGTTKLRIHRGPDYGPSTKLLGTLALERDPATLILVVDDDTEYHPRILETYLLQLAKHPNQPICSICEEPWVIPFTSYIIKYVYKIFQGTCYGWAAAYKGILYPRYLFDDSVFNYSKVPYGCVVHDDVYISGYLLRKGIRPFKVVPQGV
eukprot:jgi/Hompol1/6185/HPOL_004864-RA